MINENVNKLLNRNLAILTMLFAATGTTYFMVTTEDAFAVHPKDEDKVERDKVTVDPITNCFNLVDQGLENDGAETFVQHYEKFRNLLPSEMKLYQFPSIQTIPQLATFMNTNQPKLYEILTAISSALQVVGFSDSQQDQILSCIKNAYD